MGCLSYSAGRDFMEEQGEVLASDEPSFAHHFLWYFLQFILVAPGVMIAAIPCLGLLDLAGLSEDKQHGKFAGYEALVCLYVGVLVGWWMSRRAPLLKTTGCWIWVAPAAVYLSATLAAEFRPRPIELNGWLFASTSLGLGVLVFTLPLCSIAGYSIGMALSGRKPRELTRSQRLMTASSVVAITFCTLALLLHTYETRTLARWSKIRSVIADSLELVADPKSLCGVQKNMFTPGRVLQRGANVETLGRITCDEGRLVEMDTLPPPIAGKSGPYWLQHVRVLDGANAGGEGWVPQYGLMERRQNGF